MKMEEQKFLEPKFSQGILSLNHMIRSKAIKNDDLTNFTLSSEKSNKTFYNFTNVDDYGIT